MAVGLLLAGAMQRRAFAYIDPGTTQVIWTTLAPILGVLGVCLLAAIWPLRIAWRFASARWTKWPRRIRAISLLACIALLAGAVFGVAWLFTEKEPAPAVRTGPPPEADFRGVIVLGIDGLDPNLLERMMDAGELPHFSRLRKNGSFARLQTSTPAMSPVAWTCAATGVNPGRHGIFDFFADRDPKDYVVEATTTRLKEKTFSIPGRQPYLPVTDRPAFWNILSEHGVDVSVIRWPVTFPPQRVNGRMLSGLGTPDVAGYQATYMFYSTRTPDRPAPWPLVTVVNWHGNAINSGLPGPLMSTVGGTRPSVVPLRIERSDDHTSVKVTLADAAPVSLRPGEWSGWIRFRFPMGLGKSCPAQVKIFLASLTPALGLYVGGCQIDPVDPAFPITYPASFARELAEEIGPYHTLGLPEEHLGVIDVLIPQQDFLKKCDEVTHERERMLDYELERFDGGLLAIVFATNDMICHFFWPAEDPSHWAHEECLKAGFGPVIRTQYRRMDGMLGKVLDAAGDDVAVIVMSDHGFAGVKGFTKVTTWLVREGYMTPADTPKGEADPGSTIQADWSSTKAYALGFTGVYLNVRGREAEGIISPGDEYHQVREEIMRKLKAWTDPETGEPILRNVYAKEEIYQGPHLDQAPDIILGYYPGYVTLNDSALGEIRSGDVLVRGLRRWVGDHMFDAPTMPGVFLSNFKIETEHPRLVDICPTVLRCFNVPAPHDTDGKALF